MLINPRKTVRRLNNLPGCFIFIHIADADISKRSGDALAPLDKHFDERAGVIIHVPVFFSKTQVSTTHGFTFSAQSVDLP